MTGKDDLAAGLRRLGVTPGMALAVHSSLKSFGRVDGGAETVIAALLEAVGEEGTVFMPALRLSPPLPLTESDRRLGMVSKIRILPPEERESGMGAIADAFRKRPDVRLGEGVFRVAAWGRYAEEAAGGYRWPLEHGGKALLLGVDIYSLTAMHYAEDALPERIRAIFRPPEEVDRLYPPGEWLVETGAPPLKAWHAIQALACRQGLVREEHIGECRALFFDLAAVVGLYRRQLETDPWRLYGIAPE